MSATSTSVALPEPLPIILTDSGLLLPRASLCTKDLKDFTWYVKLQESGAAAKVESKFPQGIWTSLFAEHGEALWQDLNRNGARHTEVEFKLSASETIERPRTCRAVIAYCQNRRYLSITCRADDQSVSAALRLVATDPTGTSPVKAYRRLEVADPSEIVRDADSASVTYAFFRDSLVDIVGDALKLFSSTSGTAGTATGADDSHSRAGLVVCSGATNCFKSQLSKGLAIKYLLSLGRTIGSGKTPPHLVTFEDPIEKWSFAAAESTPDGWGMLQKVVLTQETAPDFNLWFTPRCRGADTPLLSDAVNDALRQTPACFYIGEIREDKEWEAALKLAATGHLVVVTTHAGSLAETFTRLFKSFHARDEPTRALVVNSLQGVVHLKRSDDLHHELPGPKSTFRLNCSGQIFASVWRKTTESTATLISDGIASIIPDAENVLGRRTIAQRVLRRQASPDYLAQLPPPGGVGKLAPAVPKLDPEHELVLQKLLLNWAAKHDVIEF